MLPSPLLAPWNVFLDHSLYTLLQQGATLVTASRHLAHVLQNDYGQHAQQHGLQVWSTPRILPWTTYLRLACQQQRDVEARPLRLLSDTQALTLWERIVAESETGQTLLNPAQAARSAQRSWQRMHDYGISLKQVAAYPSDEAMALASWAEEFIQRTGQRGWLDAARFVDWLRGTNHLPDAALILYGFDELIPCMTQLLQEWQARGASVTHWPLPQIASKVTVVAAQDADAELQLAAQWSRAQVEAGQTRVGVVVPNLAKQSAQVQRRFTDVFGPAQRRIDTPETPLAFRVVITPVLSSYPLVHQALLLLELVQGRADVQRVGQLLRSPFFAGYEQEASPRALADIEARERRHEEWSLAAVEALATTSECPQLAACLHALANHVREHRHVALPSVWSERMTQWLQLSGWARGRALDSHEQQVQSKFRQVLTELSALDELLGKIHMDAAVATVRDACHAERFAPEALDQTVTIIAAESVAGLSFDALWVMGLHAGEWPPAPEPDSFIPVELQRAQGVPEASSDTTLKRARARLRHLVSSSTQVVLSWPHHADDEELRRSPLLDEFDVAPGVEESTGRANAATSLNVQLFAARPTPDQWSDECAPAMTGGSVRGGTRVLELQSRCPFRAQAELRLHAKALPRISPAVEPTERGKLVHGVLAEVWQHLKHSETLQTLDLNEYVHSVRTIAARVAQQVLPFDTRHRQKLAELEVEMCTQWVMALLELDAERSAFRISRAEQIEHYELADMQIRIQLDRIDELQSGGTLLIDYKTGDNKTSEWLDAEPGRPRSPQLPLYALAHKAQLQGIAFAVMRPGQAEYRGLAARDGIAKGIDDYASLKRGKRVGVDDWNALLEHWQQILDSLARQYLSGAAGVNPLKGECDYCHLKALCRVHELGRNMDNEEAEEGGHEF